MEKNYNHHNYCLDKIMIKNYNYHNFCLDDIMSKSLSEIISKKENENYICTTIDIQIPEHFGIVHFSPLDGYNSWGGGLNALSGAEMRAIDAKYGQDVYRMIPKKHSKYFVVLSEEKYLELTEKIFTSKEEIDEYLSLNAVIYSYYRGHFDASRLVDKFPYLKTFFDELSKWRYLNDRVLIDNEVIYSALNSNLEDVSNKKRVLS